MGETSFICPEGWQMYRSVLFKKYKNPLPCNKFAIYDMDNTLMITPSYYVEDLIKGVRIPISKPVMVDDFALYAPNVREKLLNEMNNGKGILIISNQRGMLENVPLAYLIIDRIELLLKESLFKNIKFILFLVDLPLYIFLATRHDIYRKPAPGLLLFFEKYYNEGIKINRNETFYVGDAAGRRLPYRHSSGMMRNVLSILKSKDFSNHKYFNIEDNGNIVNIDASSIINKLTVSKMKNRFTTDFSDCDLKFALNNHIKFYTPDEYFYDFPSYDYKIDFNPVFIGSEPYFPSIPNGLVILIGNISSGKTYLSKNCINNFISISENNYQTRLEFLLSLKEMLTEGKDVVIDDTNHLSNTRMELVKLANSLNVNVTYVHLDLSENLIWHLIKIKRLYCDESTLEYFDIPYETGTVHSKWKIQKLKIQKPTLDEGPNVIYTITDITFPMEHNKLTSIYLP